MRWKVLILRQIRMREVRQLRGFGKGEHILIVKVMRGHLKGKINATFVGC